MPCASPRSTLGGAAARGGAARRRARVSPGAHTAPVPTVGKKPITLGSRVTIIPLGQEGEVIAITAGARCDDGLHQGAPTAGGPGAIGAGPRRGAGPAVFVAAAPPATVELELDLRGYRAAEIEALLDKYLEVRIATGCRSCASFMGRARERYARWCAISWRRTLRSPDTIGASESGWGRRSGAHSCVQPSAQEQRRCIIPARQSDLWGNCTFRYNTSLPGGNRPTRRATRN